MSFFEGISIYCFGEMCLLCGNMGLSCGNKYLFCGNVGLFCWNGSLFRRSFWSKYMSLVRDCGSFWKIIKAFS